MYYIEIYTYVYTYKTNLEVAVYLEVNKLVDISKNISNLKVKDNIIDQLSKHNSC